MFLEERVSVTWGGQSKWASYKRKGKTPMSRKGWRWVGFVRWGWEYEGQRKVH